jgi:hypothetical protein
MFDYETLPKLRAIIHERARADARLLNELRAEVRLFAGEVRKIQRRSATAVSLVASDGGNNKLAFDPFYVQLVRVADSYGKELCLDVVSPSTDTDALSEAQFNPDGSPKTALGRMMAGLGVTLLSDLSPMIPPGSEIREHPETEKQGWVLVYRDLCEWAVLYERICRSRFATDTLIVRDGLLRSKIFSRNLFMKWRKDVMEAIAKIYREDRRRVFLVGLAKHSNVITRYRLAISLEGAFPPGEPRYVRIPRALESKAYIWPEYARGAESEGEEGEVPKFVAGDLYLVRFGTRGGDPIWAVDILSGQGDHAQEIFGYLLNDAVEGFPVPFYPLCLQRAHQHAQVVDFDLDIFQDAIYRAIQGILPPEKRDIIDSMRFNSDVSLRRYG